MNNSTITDKPLELRIAIIGAGGFLGTNLAQYLGPIVKELRCFGRTQHFPGAIQGVTWISGDTDTRSNTYIDEALTGCDTVIHLAGTSVPSMANNNISNDAIRNITSSLHLFDRCVVAGIKRIIFISSGGTVYGVNQKTPISELAQTLPINSYGATKLSIEKYLAVYSHLYGIDYKVLRVSNIYGPYQRPGRNQGVIAEFISRSINCEPLEIWGNGLTVRDYIYVKDVVKAILSVLEYDGTYNIFNIGSGTGISLINIVQSIEQVLGYDVNKITKQSRSIDVPTNILNCRLAKHELDWKARTEFNDGLRETFEWIRSQA